jgi:beta-aspartyl-peptidase (threonine type)
MVSHRKLRFALLAALFGLSLAGLGSRAHAERPAYALVIHGGAGTILRENMDAETEAAYRTKLTEALHTGAQVLADGGSAVDAVEATLRVMEDSPLFNAGKGAVFTETGANEMDSSIMRGRDLQAGAVAGVKTIRNPITAARAVMEKSPHVMLAREGAEAFAAEQGLAIVDPSYFYTERRWKSLQRALENRRAEADEKHGTVGCVALDREGHLAAGTSTGGLTMKMWGRIGDSPIIGAGTYANDATCGVSATGQGEYFIRNVVAYDISARMEYLHQSLDQAARTVILDKLVAQGAEGGVVAMDKDGNVSMTFNTPGMYRGFLKSTGEEAVYLYRDEGSGNDSD